MPDEKSKDGKNPGSVDDTVKGANPKGDKKEGGSFYRAFEAMYQRWFKGPIDYTASRVSYAADNVFGYSKKKSPGGDKKDKDKGKE
jgi:hypothetical protein